MEENEPKKIDQRQTNATPLRTFKSDVEDAIKGGASSAAIVIAEQKRREQTGGFNDAEKPRLNPFYKMAIAASSVLVLFGIIFLFARVLLPNKNPPANQFAPPKFITTEFEKEMPLDGINRLKLSDALSVEKNRTFIQAASILQLYYTKKVGQDKQNVSAGDFFGLLGVTAPSAFIRSLGADFMFGYHGYNGNQPFLILKTSSYDAAFAGMLNWEKKIVNELEPLFPAPPPAPPVLIVATTTVKLKNGKMAIATTTATSTPPVFVGMFSDAILRNKDARVVRDGSGKIIFLYSFIDPSTIVITTNETTLREITARLLSASLIR